MRVLDTDVCVAILRGDSRVRDRRQATLDDVATTWISAAELFYGAAKGSNPEAKTTVVVDFLRSLEIFGLDMETVRYFGGLKAELERGGTTLADADLLIGAICLARDAVLVTGNVRHFERISGLRIENWLRDSS
jgi:tRNA(fMet)-specific endonuclease VapC